MELLNLTLLEELWLGKNKIERISGLSGLASLRRLDVQSNRLTTIDGLLDSSVASTLEEELYLLHNAITDEGAISGLLSSSNDDTTSSSSSSPFTMLTTLDLSRNRLTCTKPFAELTTLEDLWISGNDVKTFNDIDELRLLTNLDSVYLEYNPLDKEFEYRKRLAEMIPSLTQIDANKIGGNGWGGYSGGVFDLAERMRLMQDAAIERARKMETS
jgi:protein phosphatase 1 regulatory subunit 7